MSLPGREAAANSGVKIEVCQTPNPQSSSSPSRISSADSSNQNSLRSVKSVESVSTIGALPLGSLRVKEPRPDGDNIPTPLPIPDSAMEPSEASHAFLKSGDVFILDDLPAKFTVGCDTMSFATTKPFPGFRDIPPGAHLIWVAPSESTSSRSAYWLYTPEREPTSLATVYVKQWDNFNEVLNDPASQAEERFQKERLDQIFGNLSPYQFQAATSRPARPSASSQVDPLPDFLTSTAIWYQLTFAIKPGLLKRITGKTNASSWPVTSTDGVVGETTLVEESRLYANAPSQFRFVFPMDVHLINPTAEGSERTRQALDPTSWILDKLEGSTSTSDTQSAADDELVGELQFAFLTGMHIGNFSCLEQWWFFATRIVFRSYDLVTERPRLARHLIQTFHAQLVYNDRYLGGDVLEMMPENARRLQRAMVTYKARLDEKLLALGDRCDPDQHAVGVAFSSLEAWLWRLGWDLRGEYVRSGNVMLEDGEVVQAELSDFEDEDERGEFAPVVVEVEEDGRETGLVSWDDK
ncbi:A1 cistron-splicing factor [Biscogniauxia marginata]|nr:A1 cistron-splicing factor [Biscogniauxia marginata]